MWGGLSLKEPLEVHYLPYPDGHDEGAVAQAPAVDHAWERKKGDFSLRKCYSMGKSPISFHLLRLPILIRAFC